MNTILKDRVCVEVIKDFDELCEEGHSPIESYHFVIEEFLTDLDEFNERERQAEEALVYSALAYCLHREGALTEEAKQHAIAHIERGGDLYFWENESPNALNERRESWRSLAELLQS